MGDKGAVHGDADALGDVVHADRNRKGGPNRRVLRLNKSIHKMIMGVNSNWGLNKMGLNKIGLHTMGGLNIFVLWSRDVFFTQHLKRRVLGAKYISKHDAGR